MQQTGELYKLENEGILSRKRRERTYAEVELSIPDLLSLQDFKLQTASASISHCMGTKSCLKNLRTTQCELRAT